MQISLLCQLVTFSACLKGAKVNIFYFLLKPYCEKICRTCVLDVFENLPSSPGRLHVFGLIFRQSFYRHVPDSLSHPHKSL